MKFNLAYFGILSSYFMVIYCSQFIALIIILIYYYYTRDSSEGSTGFFFWGGGIPDIKARKE